MYSRQLFSAVELDRSAFACLCEWNCQYGNYTGKVDVIGEASLHPDGRVPHR